MSTMATEAAKGGRQERQFSVEFRAQGERLVLDEGRLVGTVARELDLTASALRQSRCSRASSESPSTSGHVRPVSRARVTTDATAPRLTLRLCATSRWLRCAAHLSRRIYRIFRMSRRSVAIAPFLKRADGNADAPGRWPHVHVSWNVCSRCLGMGVQGAVEHAPTTCSRSPAPADGCLRRLRSFRGKLTPPPASLRAAGRRRVQSCRIPSGTPIPCISPSDSAGFTGASP